MLAVVHWNFCYTDIPAFFGKVNNCEYAIVRGEPCHALGTALGTRLLGTVADPSKDMQTNKLSARAVSTLKDPGRHSDGGGLYLLVKATGARSWVFMWSRQGRQREMGLGSVLGVSLAVAREKAAEARADLAAGRDPLGTRDRLKAKTFGELADAHVAAMSPQWRNPKHIAQWTMTLTEYAAPLRGKTAAAITTEDVLEVLRPLWTTKPETASRVRGRIESVLDAAKAQGLRSGDNPARWRGHLDQLLPKRAKLSRGHHAAMAIDELPAFMGRLSSVQGVSAMALRFTVFTAVRTGEAIGATWSEVDFDKGIWVIPASRMKAGREHRIPLPSPALTLVKDLYEVRRGEFIFPGLKPGRPISNMSMDKVLRDLGVDVTVHGFRSTFRDWASERTAFPHELCEMALAHTIENKTEAAYRRGDMVEKRRELMGAWAAFCGSAQQGKRDVD